MFEVADVEPAEGAELRRDPHDAVAGRSACARRLASLRERIVRESVTRADAEAARASRAGSVGSASSVGFGPGLELLERGVAAVGASGVPADGDTLVAMRALIDRLTAVVCEAEVRFDLHEIWREHGSTSMRGWLADEAELGRRGANASFRKSQRLESWPAVLDAWTGGRVSGAQVDVVIAGVPERFASMFADHAAGVMEAIEDLDPDDTAIVVRRWVQCAEASDEGSAFRDRSSGVYLEPVPDDRAVLQGNLSRAEAAIIAAAIKDFDVPDPIDEHGDIIGPRRTMGQRTADALVAACRFAIDHREGASETGRFVPHVTLVVDAAEFRASALRGAGITSVDQLDAMAESRGWTAVERALFADALSVARHGGGTCHTVDGLELDAAAMGALCCDSVVQRVLMADGEIIDQGRKVRTATPAQRRAIIARDRRCRAPGCRTKPKFCDVHHVDQWALGGSTDVDRMVLLCGAHHREFHRPGYRMELSSDGVLTVHPAVGRTRSSHPGVVEDAEMRELLRDRIDTRFDDMVERAARFAQP